ncbi:MAG: hypothetical protein JW800_06530 [Candidatus Omnitrophica bacterium]|nr:hypothetical protein [Candidatus Omnitrophota bacterium]
MAKSKKVTQKDLKELFENTKKRLQAIGKETGIWIKKGEVELSRLSKMGKLEIDTVNLNIKKDQILKDIGKRIVDQNLADNIDDPALKALAKKAQDVISESKKKKREITQIGKKFLKSGKKKDKK